MSAGHAVVRLGLGRGHRPRPDVSCAHRPRTRTLARHLAGRARAGVRPRWPAPWGATRIRSATGWILSHPRSGRDRLRAERWFPPALNAGAAGGPGRAHCASRHARSGVPIATWTWKAVAQFVRAQFDMRLSRPSCLRYLHRLGFVCKRPKKQFVKADPEQRALRAYVRGSRGRGQPHRGVDLSSSTRRTSARMRN